MDLWHRQKADIQVLINGAGITWVLAMGSSGGEQSAVQSTAEVRRH
jgi:hypothetical protein